MSNDKSEAKNITPIVLKNGVAFLKLVVIKKWSVSDNDLTVWTLPLRFVLLRLRNLRPAGIIDLKKESINNDHIRRNDAGIQNIKRLNVLLIKADINTATDAPSKLDSILCS
jgi:hypothetical protein